jgi:hypothetical protein
MVSSEIYDKYILKAEKNSVNDNISTDRQRFAEVYNEYAIRYLEYIIGLKNEEQMRHIESLLIKDSKISSSKKERDHFSFKIPKNYFNLSSVYALGSKGNCVGKKIDLPKEVLDIERNLFMMDEYTKPSFEYRESLYTLGSGYINIFYTDFSVDAIILSYYRYPRKITLTDPNNPESHFDDTFDVDFDEKSINKIISAAVSGFDINNNSERWQLNNIFAKKNL